MITLTKVFQKRFRILLFGSKRAMRSKIKKIENGKTNEKH